MYSQISDGASIFFDEQSMNLKYSKKKQGIEMSKKNYNLADARQKKGDPPKFMN